MGNPRNHQRLELLVGRDPDWTLYSSDPQPGVTSLLRGELAMSETFLPLLGARCYWRVVGRSQGSAKQPVMQKDRSREYSNGFQRLREDGEGRGSC